MDLHPCECGEASFERQSSVIVVGNDLGRVYRGACARCGQPREFQFRLPEVPIASTRTPPTRRDLGIARAAIFEILKFMGPDDDGVPEVAFTSARGRKMRDAEPGRFRRARLEMVVATYDDLLMSHHG
jgi:hypothetical protein